MGNQNRFIFPNDTAHGAFAMMATRYFNKYGLSPEDGKLTMAKISAKSHRNGVKSPKAHLRKEITVDQILKAPIIAWPLGLFDCCGVSDGGVEQEKDGNETDGLISLGPLPNSANAIK